jgi:hypothetical protein
MAHGCIRENVRRHLPEEADAFQRAREAKQIRAWVFVRTAHISKFMEAGLYSVYWFELA